MIPVASVQPDGTTLLARKVGVAYLLEECLPAKHSWADDFRRVEDKLSFQALRLARYVQKYGFPVTTSPITIGADKRLIDGHLRVYVASLLGIEEVEVVQWLAASSSSVSRS